MNVAKIELVVWTVTYIICAVVMYFNIGDVRRDKEFVRSRYAMRPTREIRNALILAIKDHRNERKRGIETILALFVAALALTQPISNATPSLSGFFIGVLLLTNGLLTMRASILDRYDRKRVLSAGFKPNKLVRWLSWSRQSNVELMLLAALLSYVSGMDQSVLAPVVNCISC